MIYNHCVCNSINSASGGGGGGGVSSEKTAALEHKLYKLQEELTELHRQKGEVVCSVPFNF